MGPVAATRWSESLLRGVPPPAWVPAGWGYGVTKDTKDVPEDCTNNYHGIYHGICHEAFL